MIGITRPDGVTVRLEFRHKSCFSRRVDVIDLTTGEKVGTATTPHGIDLGKKSKTVYHSLCRIIVRDANVLNHVAVCIGEGQAFCSIHEKLRPRQSIQEEGRKRSLDRALGAALRGGHIDHPEHVALLRAYHSRPRGKTARKLQDAHIAAKAAAQPSTTTE